MISFEKYEGYNKPKVLSINKYVSIAIYMGKGKRTFVEIVSTKDEETTQSVKLYPKTLEKILTKIVD